MVDLAQTIEEWKDLCSVKVDDQVLKNIKGHIFYKSDLTNHIGQENLHITRSKCKLIFLILNSQNL